MPQKHRIVVGAIGLVVVVILLLTARNMVRRWACETPSEVAPESQLLAMVRISDCLFQPLATRKIECTTPVDERIMGTHLLGTCHTTGHLTLKLVPDENQVALLLTLQGTSVSQTEGEHRPVQTENHCVTEFTATKRLLFQRGAFHADPAKVSARAKSTTDDVTTDVPGLRGEIVERVAHQQIARTREQWNAVSARLAKKHVAEAFDRDVEKYLQGLNNSLALKRIFHQQQYADSQLSMHCSTTRDYIQICVFLGHQTEEMPPALPFDGKAPVEVCVNLLAVGENLPDVLQALGHTEAMLHSYTPESGWPDDSSKAISAKPVSLHFADDGRWGIVKFDVVRPKGSSNVLKAVAVSNSQ